VAEKQTNGVADQSAGVGADLRGLAAVDEVLRQPGVAALLVDFPRTVVVDAVRAVIDRLRKEILAGERSVGAGELSPEMLVPWVDSLVRMAMRPSMTRVVNALGVVGHTNLGRAILPYESIDAIAMAAGNYTDLEMSLVTSERASRQDHLHDILCTLTGAEDALVVNNNAAAVLLALTAAARGGEVLVARGQLVEIGDGFRIPDILRESGAELVEVGTTNRTYLRDYENAWSERTRAVLRVHSSNYRIVGFATEPSVQELAGLTHDRGALCIDDLGSGALAELPLFAGEPPVRQSVDAGADIVTFSGDKLLGGPQAGIAVGSAASIQAMRTHPLARALRIDKLSVAGLDALLRLYLDPERAVRRVPTLAMLAATEAELQVRAEHLKELVTAAWPQAGERLEVVPTVARAGAGALPVTDVPSRALAVDPPGGDAGGLAGRLRRGEPPVLARVHGDRVLLDVLAVRDSEVDELAVALATALA
jgi:L-seryl-tRNA(Ser) seleniumtransferase